MASSRSTTSLNAVAASLLWQAQSIFPPSTIRKKPLERSLDRKLIPARVISAKVMSPFLRSIAYGIALTSVAEDGCSRIILSDFLAFF